jgi:hypothetical protein
MRDGFGRGLQFALAGLATVGLAVASVFRHDHFGSNAYDLGLFDQTIWGYSRLELLPNTVVRLPNLLGDHFHPILVALAPLYWVWSDPRVLLVAQAAAFGALERADLPVGARAARRSRRHVVPGRVPDVLGRARRQHLPRARPAPLAAGCGARRGLPGVVRRHTTSGQIAGDPLLPRGDPAGRFGRGALVPHLSHRREIYVLDGRSVPETEFVAIDVSTWMYPLTLRDVGVLIARKRRDGFGVSCSRRTAAVLARDAPDRLLSPELSRLLAGA